MFFYSAHYKQKKKHMDQSIIASPEAAKAFISLFRTLLSLVLSFIKAKGGIVPSELHELGLSSYDHNGRNNWLPYKILQILVQKGCIEQRVKGGKYYPKQNLRYKKMTLPSYDQVQAVFVPLLDIVHSRFIRKNGRTKKDIG